jgi:hypothetical protein
MKNLWVMENGGTEGAPLGDGPSFLSGGPCPRGAPLVPPFPTSFS